MRDDLLDEMMLYPYPDPPKQSKSDLTTDSFVAPSVSFAYDQVCRYETAAFSPREDNSVM